VTNGDKSFSGDQPHHFAKKRPKNIIYFFVNYSNITMSD